MVCKVGKNGRQVFKCWQVGGPLRNSLLVGLQLIVD